MGYRITKDDLHVLQVHLSIKMLTSKNMLQLETDGLFIHHKDLVKGVATASLDPKSACQATGDTWDTMF